MKVKGKEKVHTKVKNGERECKRGRERGRRKRSVKRIGK